MTLDSFYDPLDGELVGDPPPTEVQISLGALGDHPFIWATDSLVFAGPDARTAALRYQERRGIGYLVTAIYKILDTDPDGVMQLYRVL